MTGTELERIAEAEEIEITPLRRDGTPRTSVPIWVVQAGQHLYVEPMVAPAARATTLRLVP